MTESALLAPMAAHVAWVALLYALLTVVRAPSVWGLGARPDGSNPWQELEPRVAANLKNQFEWPLMFYVVCTFAFVKPFNIELLTVMAWVFVAGRALHTGVQVLTSNIRLRGLVFTINFVAVLAMWAIYLGSWESSVAP